VWRCGLDSCGSGWGLMVDFCEHGNKPSGFLIIWTTYIGWYRFASRSSFRHSWQASFDFLGLSTWIRSSLEIDPERLSKWILIHHSWLSAHLTRQCICCADETTSLNSLHVKQSITYLRNWISMFRWDRILSSLHDLFVSNSEDIRRCIQKYPDWVDNEI
jgi:hypothetical protein